MILFDVSNYQDPLHILLDYIAEVSVCRPCVPIIVRNWVLQKAPDCELALVHDDDLKDIVDGVSLCLCSLCIHPYLRSRCQ